jgi:predicted MPP superfamily phosphohydrolase
MTFRCIGLGLAVLAACGLGAQNPGDLQGIVFEDVNGNGTREAGEPGIEGVVVSNQIDSVITTRDGSFRLDPNQGYGIVYVGTPASYRPHGRFWQRIPSDSNDPRVDFAMVPVSVPEAFSFLHASDTHLSEQTLPRMRRLRKVVEDVKPSFVLITGDLIEDALRVPEEKARSYYELYRREIDAFPVPVYSTLGNHEIFGIERHLSLVSKEHPLYGKEMYRRYLGPNYYSFTYGRLHFVALDNVDYEDLWYYGHVDAAQLDWLEKELSFLPAGSPLVTFMHMPLFSSSPTLLGYEDEMFIKVGDERLYRHTVSNPTEVLVRLKDYRHSLALAGHIHIREQLRFGSGSDRTRFHHVSAVRGPSRGNLGASGVVLYRVRGASVDEGEFIPLDPAGNQ